MYIVAHDGDAAPEAQLDQALEDLLGAQGVCLQPSSDLRLVRIELTRAGRCLPGLVAIGLNPLGDRAWVESEGVGDLVDIQALLLMKIA